jgi:osmotically-inducible protein OsmY
MNHCIKSRITLLGLIVIMAATTFLSGCAPIIVGGAAATTALVATDRRTVGEQVSDKEINLKIDHEMEVKFGPTARINASSYNGVVLLTGDAFSEKIRGEAAALAAAQPQVKSVINRLHVGPVASFSRITADTWLASKVKTTLLTTDKVPYGAIVVTVERGDVYLQGRVTDAEATKIAETVSAVDGVKEVYTLFEIMTPEQARTLEQSQLPDTSLPPSNPNPVGPSGMMGEKSGDNGGATSNSSAPPAGQPSVEPVTAPSTPQARPL